MTSNNVSNTKMNEIGPSIFKKNKNNFKNNRKSPNLVRFSVSHDELMRSKIIEEEDVDNRELTGYIEVFYDCARNSSSYSHGRFSRPPSNNSNRSSRSLPPRLLERLEAMRSSDTQNATWSYKDSLKVPENNNFSLNRHHTFDNSLRPKKVQDATTRRYIKILSDLKTKRKNLRIIEYQNDEKKMLEKNVRFLPTVIVNDEKTDKEVMRIFGKLEAWDMYQRLNEVLVAAR